MRRYDMGFKIDAIKLAEEIGATKASKELSIPQSTLDTWIIKNKEVNIHKEGRQVCDI